MVHITNYPLNNENTLSSTNETNANMDVDVSSDNQFENKKSSRQDIQDEKMDICNIATDSTNSITNGEAYATQKSVIASTEENKSTKNGLATSNFGFSPGNNKMNQNNNKNIIFDSSHDWINTEEKSVSNKT